LHTGDHQLPDRGQIEIRHLRDREMTALLEADSGTDRPLFVALRSNGWEQFWQVG